MRGCGFFAADIPLDVPTSSWMAELLHTDSHQARYSVQLPMLASQLIKKDNKPLVASDVLAAFDLQPVTS